MLEWHKITVLFGPSHVWGKYECEFCYKKTLNKDKYINQECLFDKRVKLLGLSRVIYLDHLQMKLYGLRRSPKRSH